MYQVENLFDLLYQHFPSTVLPSLPSTALYLLPSSRMYRMCAKVFYKLFLHKYQFPLATFCP